MARIVPVLRGEEALRAAEALIAHRAQCTVSFGHGTPGPMHDHMWYDMTSGLFHNGGCSSGSLFYNVNTGKIEGRAHCTCDYCF